MNIEHVIDLTHMFANTIPVHPYDDQLHLNQKRTIDVDGYNDYQLTMGMHVGTHIDGPAHLVKDAPPLNIFPSGYFVRPGVLIDARDRIIDEGLFDSVVIKSDDIVLVMTGHSKTFGKKEYFINHPIVTSSFAQGLIARKINMVGFDCPSPDKHPFEIHKMLMQRNILIVENLTNLELLLERQHFTVIALPLKILSDSAPARVVAVYE